MIEDEMRLVILENEGVDFKVIHDGKLTGVEGINHQDDLLWGDLSWENHGFLHFDTAGASFSLSLRAGAASESYKMELDNFRMHGVELIVKGSAYEQNGNGDEEGPLTVREVILNMTTGIVAVVEYKEAD